MLRSKALLNSPLFKLFTIALLIISSAVLAVFFRIVLHTDIVYTHFFYIPIVLASIWWGRKGSLVGITLAVIVFSFHLFGLGMSKLWNDVARVLFFVIVALFIGTLKEKVMAGQKALQASEEKYRLLIEKSIAGIFVHRNGTILFANSHLGVIMGLDHRYIIGKSLWDFIYREDRSKVRSITDSLMNSRRSPGRYECRLIGSNGRVIWVDVASSLTDYGGEPAVMVNVYDISERKKAAEKHRELREITRKQEEQLVHSTRLAELGEMAAGISHELNQPLTGIRNFSKNALYMLENNIGNPEEIKNNLRRVSEQVDRASKIINKMREFTRRTELNFTKLDLNSIIRESVDFLMPQMRLADVKVSVDLDEHLPKITGDKIRLEQVLLNLLTNAKQAMEETQMRNLTVRTYYDAESNYPVVVEVEDSGKGFSPENSKKLFAPFFTTKETGHGTGLGLSISLSIIKDHGGYIEATGKPGKGAVFTVSIPLPNEQGDIKTKNSQ